MTTTLICTVGGSHQPIITAIGKLHPDHVCFVCSGDDPATGSKGSYIQITGKGSVIKAHPGDKNPSLPNIPTQAGLAEDQFEVLEVQPDDLDDVYRKVSGWLAGQDRSETTIVADYTGGTKTMSAGLVLAALDDEGVELKLVTGSRSNLQKIDSSAERVRAASIKASRFARQVDRALSAWRRFAYDEAVRVLERMSPPPDADLQGQYDRVLDLSQAFACWDRFDHQGAYRILDRYRKVLGGQWPDLYGALKLLLDEERSEPARILDLWRNAERRASQGRYDDAVARLYRLLEWTAQWILRERASIETADVPADKIPEGLVLTKNREGKYQAPLTAAWTLAVEYGGDAVVGFWNAESARMLDHLKARNHSILAHGFEPLGEAQWQEFSGWVEEKVLPLLLSIAGNRPYRIKRLPEQLPREMAR